MSNKCAISCCLVFFLAVFCISCNDSSVSAPEQKPAHEQNQEQHTDIVWHDFDDGIRLAKSENKVLVVDFYATWCSWCRVMEESTYKNQRIIDYAVKHLIMAKLDCETGQRYAYKGKVLSGRELAALFGVTAFPTTGFFDSNGELLTTVVGYIEVKEFFPILQYMGGKWYETMTYQEWLDQNRGG